MKNALLNVLAGIAMLCVTIFHDNSVVAGLSLMVMGLAFWHPAIGNYRKDLAIALIIISGFVMIIGHPWWPLMSAAGGTFFVISDLSQRKDAFSILEMLIGLSWFGLALPFGCLLAAVLILFLALIQVIVAAFEEMVEVFDPA